MKSTSLARLTRALLVVACSTGTSAVARDARAQAPAVSASGERTAAAEELFTQGRALLDAGRLSEACPKLAESQKLDPSAGTLLGLADCYEKNGQTASAWATFSSRCNGRRPARRHRLLPPRRPLSRRSAP